MGGLRAVADGDTLAPVFMTGLPFTSTLPCGAERRFACGSKQLCASNHSTAPAAACKERACGRAWPRPDHSRMPEDSPG